MFRLTCVVEGHGEVNALPNLCSRIITYLGVSGWYVDSEPIRLPRSLLVDEGTSSPKRNCNKGGICRALGLAAARSADGVLTIVLLHGGRMLQQKYYLIMWQVLL